MNWDYNKKYDFNVFNSKLPPTFYFTPYTEDEIINILNQHYPIGDIFEYKEANISPISHKVQITGYIKNSEGYYFTKIIFLNLNINTNMDSVVSPNKLKPTLRNLNLKELGI